MTNNITKINDFDHINSKCDQYDDKETLHGLSFVS